MFEIKKSKIDGRGVFATKAIRKRQKIGEITGEFISLDELDELMKTSSRIQVWEFLNGKILHLKSDLRYLNPACTPNAFARCLGYRIEVYARIPIKLGQEITVDYGPWTHHEGKLRCRCGCESRYL